MPGMHRHAVARSPGLDVLEQRYARGEINRDEYLQKKQDLVG
jgi:putative membrane protein